MTPGARLPHGPAHAQADCSPDLARFDGYLAAAPSLQQALLDLERLADCLSYYAYRFRDGDGDCGSRACIALSDVMGWERRG